MNINYLIKRYEEADKLKDWHPLIGYQQLLLRWQTKHEKNVLPIAKVASHWHGYIEVLCERPSINHPVPHARCNNDCQNIEKMLQENLQQRLLYALMEAQRQKGQMLLIEA